MQFADSQATSTAFLILRHLYDGDVIEWPIGDDHPQREIFEGLEAQGYVARWDRIWPLHDRYRLTERGIATIEAVYKPAGADAFFDEMRQQNLSPANRRAYLTSRRLDPMLWPLLHDPSTHWSNFGTVRPRYLSYIWEDQQPARRRRPPAGRGPRVVDPHDPNQHGVVLMPQRDPQLVDLDREAQDAGEAVAATADYDVS